MAIKLGEKELFPYLGDYRPVNIYKGEHKVAGWKWAEQSGEELHFENTYNDFVEVEIDGKSYQGGDPSPDYPIEIHSLNDFDVVSSVGRRNLIKNGDFRDGLDEWKINASRYTTLEDGYLRVNSGRSSAGPYQHIDDIEVGDTVTISALIRGSGAIWLGMRWSGHNEIEIPSEWERVSSTITRTGDSVTVTLYTASADSYFDITDIKVEFGTKATPYTPAPEEITENDNHPLIDKINILLSEPLRSVGDVKDRLFRDSDGLWKVERNVGEFIEAVIETLSQELQDKLNNLRSFQDSNYVYTTAENLKPTLHARLKVKDI